MVHAFYVEDNAFLYPWPSLRLTGPAQPLGLTNIPYLSPLNSTFGGKSRQTWYGNPPTFRCRGSGQATLARPPDLVR